MDNTCLDHGFGENGGNYSAAIRMGRRIASREMLPDCWLLPHLICSRHLWVRSKSDEVDQRDDEK